LTQAIRGQGDRCPVCQARFRGDSVCSRCGADLARPMYLAATAWRLREEARRSIEAGEFGLGRELASKAQETQNTRAGDALLRLGEWLENAASRSSGAH
jgi:hypothetical protein